MTRFSSSKLNNLLINLPEKGVLTSEWLKSQGISPKLCWWYLHSGWIERLGERAYKRVGVNVSWGGVVSALQEQLSLPIHIGGKSALQILGQAHFIPMQDYQKVDLFSDPRTHLPKWVNESASNYHFKLFRTTLFERSINLISIVRREVDGVELMISCPERAILELLYLVPTHEAFDEAALVMENLGFMRVSILQSLLENCHSIKVKRLFLHFAKKNAHQWFAELDQSKIFLGKGKRMIGKGGQYDSIYQLSVPALKDAEEDVFTNIP
jgi:hypothetical protein